jgi:hypothetical protein
MADDSVPVLTPHGALRLPAVDIESYNTELKDDQGSSVIARTKALSAGSSTNGASRCVKSSTIRSVTPRRSNSPRNNSIPCSSAATARRPASSKAQSKASRRSSPSSYSAS